jgi:hypothetical protein
MLGGGTHSVHSSGLKIAAVGALVLAAFGVAGCPLLMIGGLGYTGYQYAKTGKIPGMPDTSSQSSNEERKPTSQATPDNSIE